MSPTTGGQFAEPRLDPRFTPQGHFDARAQLIVGEKTAERVEVSDEPVRRADVLRRLAAERLRPEARVVAFGDEHGSALVRRIVEADDPRRENRAA